MQLTGSDRQEDPECSLLQEICSRLKPSVSAPVIDLAGLPVMPIAFPVTPVAVPVTLPLPAKEKTSTQASCSPLISDMQGVGKHYICEAQDLFGCECSPQQGQGPFRWIDR